MTEPQGLAVGQLRSMRKLGSRAVYRVCGWDETHVEVEVVSAPGLAAGQRWKFTLEAVHGMEVVL